MAVAGACDVDAARGQLVPGEGMCGTRTLGGCSAAAAGWMHQQDSLHCSGRLFREKFPTLGTHHRSVGGTANGLHSAARTGSPQG